MNDLPPPLSAGSDLFLFGLSGRLVVVTGAASGIGRTAALMLACAGATCVLADLDADGLAATTDSIVQSGGRAFWQRTNCADRQEIEALASEAERTGPIHGWCNVAGVVAKQAAIDVDTALYDRVMGINMGGTYWGSTAAARRMIAHGGGAIVNISSNAADEPMNELSLYAMSKAGVNMMTRSFAKELGPHGIRVNAVAPGFTLTGMTAPTGSDEGAIIARNAARSPLGRVGMPEDIAFAMLYLLSDASRFITGQILRANGGTSMP
jgi:3-oxoacyl-[acyl-carrier protein] reductase